MIGQPCHGSMIGWIGRISQLGSCPIKGELSEDGTASRVALDECTSSMGRSSATNSCGLQLAMSLSSLSFRVFLIGYWNADELDRQHLV